MSFTVGDAKSHVAQIETLLAKPEALTAHVKSAFAHFDKDQSGFVDYQEAQDLVADLCKIMNLPVPTYDEFSSHFKILDQDTNGKLSENEIGSGFVSAFQYKVGSLKHFLAFAERDNLPDSATLPSQ